MPHDVFISHSRQDKTIADAVCAKLEQEHIRCWIAPRDIRPGADWGSAIIEGIKGSKVLVLILSGAANSSSHIAREVERAVHLGRAIIPFRIQDVTPQGALEYHLGLVHWLDALTPPLENHIAHLVETLRAILRSEVVRPGAAASSDAVSESDAVSRSTGEIAPSKAAPTAEPRTNDRLDANDKPRASLPRRPALIVGLALVLAAAAGTFLWKHDDAAIDTATTSAEPATAAPTANTPAPQASEPPPTASVQQPVNPAPAVTQAATDTNQSALAMLAPGTYRCQVSKEYKFRSCTVSKDANGVLHLDKNDDGWPLHGTLDVTGTNATFRSTVQQECGTGCAASLGGPSEIGETITGPMCKPLVREAIAACKTERTVGSLQYADGRWNGTYDYTWYFNEYEGDPGAGRHIVGFKKEPQRVSFVIME